MARFVDGAKEGVERIIHAVTCSHPYVLATPTAKGVGRDVESSAAIVEPYGCNDLAQKTFLFVDVKVFEEVGILLTLLSNDLVDKRGKFLF